MVDKAVAVMLWQDCSAPSDPQKVSDEAETSDTQALASKKCELLETFFKRYDWRLPLDLTPSDSTFQIIARVRKRKSTEFIPLSRVTSAAETRDITVEHVRIKGTNGDLLIDPSRGISKKNADFTKSAESFIFEIRLLMYGYTLASCADEREHMWCPLQAAVRHITTVENHLRSAARVSQGLHPEISDAEMSVRREWHAVGQAEPSLSLAAIIELVCQRHSIWPSVLELRPVNKQP